MHVKRNADPVSGAARRLRQPGRALEGRFMEYSGEPDMLDGSEGLFSPGPQRFFLIVVFFCISLLRFGHTSQARTRRS